MERRRITTGQALAALGLVLLGLVVGWLTAGDGGDSSDGKGAANAGPTDTVEGVPVGYERSREGAVAAAVNYGAVLAEPAYVADARRRSEILTAIATDDFARRYKDAPGLADVAETPLYRGAREGVRTIWTGAPLGYRVERYSDDEAVVFLWSVAIAGSAQVKPQAAFSSGSTTLRWDGEDWKVAAGRNEVGPVPAPLEGTQATSGDEFTTRLSDLQGLRHAP